jgi:hypothetical protein
MIAFPDVMHSKYVYTDDKQDKDAIKWGENTFFHLMPDAPKELHKKFKDFKKELIAIQKEQEKTGIFII